MVAVAMVSNGFVCWLAAAHRGCDHDHDRRAHDWDYDHGEYDCDPIDRHDRAHHAHAHGHARDPAVIDHGDCHDAAESDCANDEGGCGSENGSENESNDCCDDDPIAARDFDSDFDSTRGGVRSTRADRPVVRLSLNRGLLLMSSLMSLMLLSSCLCLSLCLLFRLFVLFWLQCAVLSVSPL